MVTVDYKTFWIFRCDDFNLEMRAKYVYGAKCFKKLNFELLHFTVSLLTAGWHLRKVFISVSWHLAHDLVSQFIDCLVG